MKNLSTGLPQKARGTIVLRLVSRKWIQNLTDEQKDLLLGLFIILIVAIIYYFQWAYYLTGLQDSKVNIDQPAKYFWWANDSRSYRAAGEWLFGRDDNTAIGHRPWLYPLLLGLARTLFAGNAESIMWVSQFLMWLGSGILIYLSLQSTTRSTVLSMLGAGFFFSHPSPLILTFHGMTETLNILLISAFCWVLTTTLKNRIYYALLLIALATVTKPIFLLFLILLAVYVLVQYKRSSPVDKQTTRFQQLGLIALLLLPIWIQLLLSFLATGKPTISSIGSYTFKNYLVADVYLRSEGTEWRETMKIIEDWNVQQQMTYLWEHQRMTLLTVRNHLIDSNLLTGSFFALGPGNRMRELSITMNTVSAYLHLLMLPLVIYYLLSRKYSDHPRSTIVPRAFCGIPVDRETIALLYICFLLQFLTSGISTGQDDRLMITALPLWIIAYMSVLKGISATRAAPDAIVTS